MALNAGAVERKRKKEFRKEKRGVDALHKYLVSIIN
jgi:hypothetical protein